RGGFGRQGEALDGAGARGAVDPVGVVDAALRVGPAIDRRGLRGGGHRQRQRRSGDRQPVPAHWMQAGSRSSARATSRRSKAATARSLWTANRAPAGKRAVEAACSTTPSVQAVTCPLNAPRGARLTRSKTRNTVSGRSWSTAIQ